MKKLLWILCIVLAVTGLFFFSQQVAAELTISGDVITDSETGLEWLVMSRTVGISPDSIKDGNDNEKLASLGWVHATIEQIETLLLDAGMTGPFNGVNTPGNFTGAKFLIDMMGHTYEYNNPYFGEGMSFQAFSAAPGQFQGSLYTPSLLVGLSPSQIGGADIPGPSVPSFVASPAIANWLVRGNPTSLFDLTPANLWLGLKNSDDQGTQFDVMAQLYINNILAAQGETRCITGLTRNPSMAKEIAVPFDPLENGEFKSGDTLSLKVYTRIGTTPGGLKCTGPGGSHNNALGIRLYYDSQARNSGFGVTIDEPEDLFLHSGGSDFFLDSLPPIESTSKYKDSAGINFKGANPWVEVGTWSMVLP